MAGMYVEREPLEGAASTRDLNQGDLLGGIVASVVVLPLALTIQEGPRVRDPRHVETGELLASLPNARVVLRVVRHECCMVLSNSCDNARGFDLLLAPIDVFPLVEEVQQQWPQVSNAATGTANPKRFYLPGAPEFGLQRSEINFQKIFVISQEYLARWIGFGLTRIAGLTPEAQHHLAWTFSVWICRNPREDLNWPSVDDLNLKLAWLRRQIDANAGPPDFLNAQCEEIEAELARRAAH